MSAPHHDAVASGAGFSGLYMLHRLRAAGHRVPAVEAAGYTDFELS